MYIKKINSDIGIVSFMTYPEIVSDENAIIEKILKITSDDFFSFIEICHIENNQIREKVKNILEISNMRVGFDAHPDILSKNLNINSRDKELINITLNELKKLIDEAYYMGAEGFTILSGFKPDTGYFSVEVEIAINSLKVLCEYAIKKSKELGVKPIDIVIETFDDKEYAKNRLIGPTKLAVSVAEKVNTEYKNFGLLLDLSHMPILGEDFGASLMLAKNYIKHIHIGNCIIKDISHPVFGDNHPRFGILGGENSINTLSFFINALKKINYFNRKNNTLIFEVKPIKGEDSDLTLAGSKRALIRALNLL